MKQSETKRQNNKSGRISKEDYYLNIAAEVSRRGTCLRRNFGAVIVKEEQIISTGYCGAPRGTVNCSDVGKCYRQELKIPAGSRYELCRGVHAEQNAIIHASRLDMIGATLYLVGLDAKTNSIVKDSEPCRMCKRMIINAGITHVVVRSSEKKVTIIPVKRWVKTNLREIRKKGKTYVSQLTSGY